MGNKSIQNDLKKIFSNKPKYKIIATLEDSAEYITDKNICAFKSLEDIYYLIYTSKDESIISYNIIRNQRINQIKIVYGKKLPIFEHHLDKANKRDLILMLLMDSKALKILNIKNFECILNLSYICGNVYALDSCFLSISQQIYIVIPSYIGDHEQKVNIMKIYNLKGDIIKEIDGPKGDITNVLISYYDKKLEKNYIIACNNYCIRSYDYDKNKNYRKYIIEEYSINHKNILMYDKGKIIQLLDCCTDGKLRVWNFHTGKLLHNIKIHDSEYGYLYSLSLNDEENLFVSSVQGNIYLINLRYGIIIDKILGHEKEDVFYVKKN